MQKLLLLIIAFGFFFNANAQDTTQKKLVFDSKKTTYTVETTCGNCLYKMKGEGCHLAIKLKNKNYFVDGTNIDDHGDAHDTDGFCNAIKKAKVQGEIRGDRFMVSYFELIK